MASELGQLFYSLGLEDKDFQIKIEKIKRDVQGLSGKDITLNTNASEVLAKVEALNTAITTLKANSAEIVIGDKIGGVGSVKPTLDKDAGVKLKTEIEEALKGITINGINAQSIVSSITTALGGGVPVTLTCNAQSVSQLVGDLIKQLNTRKVTIRLYPSMAKADLAKLKNEIETKVKEVKLRNVTVELASKKDVQAKLDKISGLMLPVEIKLHTNTLQAQLNKIGANITLNNSNLGGGDNGREEGQKRVNKAAKTELGIRRAINDQMSRNTQLATMLGNVMGNVFASYQVKNFLENLIQIGGEIQKQRMALEHILQSSSKADTIFGQMKDLAIKSPFGLQDLMQNARQLSAFGVQYNELFDTMKRLSDVAAGLGIQFGRLSLAFGETLERTYLDGKLIRQYAYMGLPILQKLADYYTEIGKAGKGVKVTAAEVREMVSNRQVSFEDVKAVFKELTDAGGQFGNMQEVMAESVAGKWKNVSDAIEVMYSNMVEGNSEILKAPAEILIALTRNYRDFEGVLVAVATAMVGAKMASKMSTLAMGENVATVWQNEMANRKLMQTEARRAAILGIATEEQKKMLVSTKGLNNARLQELAIENKLSESEKRRLIIQNTLATRFKTFDKETAKILIQMRLLTAESVRQASSTNVLTMSWGRAKIALASLTAYAKLATAELRMMAAAMISNPMTWIFALVAGVTTLINKINEAEEKAQELKNRIAEALGEKSESARKVSMSIEITADMSFDDMQNQIDAAIQEIKNTMPELAKDVNEIMKVDSDGNWAIPNIEDRLRKLKELTDVYRKWTEQAQHIDVSNMFDDMSKYSKILSEGIDEAYPKLIKLIKDNKLSKLNGNVVTEADIAEFLLGDPSKMKENFDKYMKDASDELVESDAINDFRTKLVHTLEHSWVRLPNFVNAVADTKKKVQDTMKSIFGNVDWNNLTGAQEMVMKVLVNTYIEKSEASDTVKAWMKKNWYQIFKIGVEVDFNKMPLDGWQRDLDNAFGKKFTEEIKSASSYRDAIENIRKKFKELKKDVEQSSGMYAQLKIDVVTQLKGNKIISAIPTAKNLLDKLFPGVMGDASKKAIADEFNSQVVDLYNAAVEGFDKIKTKPEADSTKDTGKNKTDEKLKEWKEQFDELKKAYSEYQKWAAKVGKENAGKKVAELGIVNTDLLKMLGIDLKSLGSAEGYKKAVETFLGKIQGQLKSSVERKKFETSINAEIGTIELNIKDEAIKKAQEKAQREINMAAKQFDIWKSWFGATGDSGVAEQMAKSIGIAWNKQSEDLLATLKKELGDRKVDFSFGMNVDSIEMQKKFLALGTDDAQSLYDIWKNINDLVVNYGVELSKSMAEILKNSDDYEIKMRSAQEALNQQIDNIKNTVSDTALQAKLIEEAVKKSAESTSKMMVDSLKKSLNWDMIFSNLNSVSGNALNELEKVLEAVVNNSKDIDPTNLKTLYELLDKVRNAKVSKAGLFGGMSETMKELSAANNTLKQLQNVGKVGELADALQKLNNVKKSGDMVAYFALLGNNKKYKFSVNGKEEILTLKQYLDKLAIAETNVAKGATLMQKNMQEFANRMNKVGSIVKNTVSAMGISGSTSNLINGVANTFTGITSAVSNIDFSKSFFGGGIDNVLNNMDQMSSIASNIAGLVQTFKDAQKEAAQRQMEYYNSMRETLMSISDQIVNRIERALKESGGVNMAESVNNIIEENQSKQSSILETLFSKLGETLQDYAKNNSTPKTVSDNKNANPTIGHSVLWNMNKGNWGYSNWKDIAKEFGFDSLQDLLSGANLEQLYELQSKYAGSLAQNKDIAETVALLIQFKEEVDGINVSSEFLGTKWEDFRDSFVDACTDMSASADDLANNIYESLNNAIISTMVNRVFGEDIKKIYDNIGTYYGNDDRIDEQEMAMLSKQTDELAKRITEYRDQMKETGLLKDTESTSSSVSNSIKGVSEETADVLAAYMNGMRMDLSAQRLAVERIAEKICGEEGSEDDGGNLIAQAQLTQLQQIANHTLRNAEAAEAMKETLDAVVNGTKSWSIQ